MPIQVTCACGKQCEFGDELAGWLAKCPACGRPVAVPRTGAGAGPGAQFPVAPRPRRKRRTAIFVILGAAGLVVVAGLLVVVFYLPGGPESREGVQSEPVVACFEVVLAFYEAESGSKQAGELYAGDEVKILGMEKGRVNVSTKDLSNVWVDRLNLCRASEFQKFKADGNIPNNLVFMTAKNGQLSFVGGAMYVRHGAIVLTKGCAICFDDETLGQSLNLAGTSIVSRPNTLYVCCKGGSIRELKILPGAPESREGGPPSSVATSPPAPAAAQPAPAAPTPAAPAELTLDLGGGVTMKMVLIRPGKFMMGNEGQDRHEVTISKPFYLGATEVTQAQYEAVMGTNPSQFKGATNPVEMVFRNDAAEFCRKLSEKTRQAVRLPTDAEWEYACRAGTQTKFSFGNNASALGDYAWWDGNSGETTHPVGQKKPNAWGLYDMHGNVWEWCADWYEPYPKGPVTDPSGPAAGHRRVLRGESWRGFDSGCFRCAYRLSSDPADRDSSVGFRCARTL
jgi:formylglycine-generating enzyme required for sulfatase activity